MQVTKNNFRPKAAYLALMVRRIILAVKGVVSEKFFQFNLQNRFYTFVLPIKINTIINF